MSIEERSDCRSVTVTYTFADVFGAIVHSWRRLLRLLVIIELLWLVLSVGVDVVHGAPLRQALSWLDWKLFLIGGLAVAALWFGLCPLVGYVRLKRAGVKGPNTFTLLDRGLEVETPRSEAVIYWSAIRRTVRTSSRFYIFLVSGGGIIVPKRAFKSDSDFGAFADATERMRKADQLT